MSPATREKLTVLKSSSRESYDELLNKLFARVPIGDDEGWYTDAFRVELLEARLDVLAGRLDSHEDVKRRLSLLRTGPSHGRMHRSATYSARSARWPAALSPDCRKLPTTRGTTSSDSWALLIPSFASSTIG